MNAEDVTQKLSYIQQANGHTLNIEERAAIQCSLPILKRNGKFAKMVFWGKIYGLKKDYLIAQGYPCCIPILSTFSYNLFFYLPFGILKKDYLNPKNTKLPYFSFLKLLLSSIFPPQIQQ
jgi:hypothetical protein